MMVESGELGVRTGVRARRPTRPRPGTAVAVAARSGKSSASSAVRVGRRQSNPSAETGMAGSVTAAAGARCPDDHAANGDPARTRQGRVDQEIGPDGTSRS